MFAWWICPPGRIRFSPPAPHLMSYPCLVHQKRVSCTAVSIQNVLLAPWTSRCEKPCAPKTVSSWQRLSWHSRCDQIRSPGSTWLQSRAFYWLLELPGARNLAHLKSYPLGRDWVCVPGAIRFAHLEVDAFHTVGVASYSLGSLRDSLQIQFVDDILVNMHVFEKHQHIHLSRKRCRCRRPYRFLSCCQSFA